MTRDEAILSGEIENILKDLIHLKTGALFASTYIEGQGAYFLAPLTVDKAEKETIKAIATGMKAIQNTMVMAGLWSECDKNEKMDTSCDYSVCNAEGDVIRKGYTDSLSFLFKKDNWRINNLCFFINLPPTDNTLNVLKEEVSKIKARENVLELFQRANILLMEHFSPQERLKATCSLLKQAGISLRKTNTKTPDI